MGRLISGSYSWGPEPEPSNSVAQGAGRIKHQPAKVSIANDLSRFCNPNKPDRIPFLATLWLEGSATRRWNWARLRPGVCRPCVPGIVRAAPCFSLNLVAAAAMLKAHSERRL